jgi:hypothetical protein
MAMASVMVWADTGRHRPATKVQDALNGEFRQPVDASIQHRNGQVIRLRNSSAVSLACRGIEARVPGGDQYRRVRGAGRPVRS